MANGNGNGHASGGGSALAALFSALGLLIAFSLLFATFLIVPFFFFIAGIIAMIVSDRRRSPDRVAEEKAEQEQARLSTDEERDWLEQEEKRAAVETGTT